MPESDVPDPTVRGDAALLQTMVENLIRNAIRFSNAGADVDIVVTQGPRTVTIVVRDRGPGIPAAQLERVFDRFLYAPDGPEIAARHRARAGHREGCDHAPPRHDHRSIGPTGRVRF